FAPRFFGRCPLRGPSRATSCVLRWGAQVSLAAVLGGLVPTRPAYGVGVGGRRPSPCLRASVPPPCVCVPAPGLRVRSSVSRCVTVHAITAEITAPLRAARHAAVGAHSPRAGGRRSRPSPTGKARRKCKPNRAEDGLHLHRAFSV